MIRHLHTIDDIKAAQAEAATMSAHCPLCGGRGRVREQIRQATRREPARLLCFQGFCVPCQMSFPLDSAQLALA